MSLWSKFTRFASNDNKRKPVTIETPRLMLCEHKMSDIDTIHAITQKEGFSYSRFDDTREKVEDYIKFCIEAHEAVKDPKKQKAIYLAVIVKETGELIGHVNLRQEKHGDKTFDEINFFIDPAHQNKGYGHEGIVNLMNYGFTVLGYDHFVSTIHPKNAPSIRVAEKEGGQIVGEVTLKTTKGEEPRVLLKTTFERFMNVRKNDKRPLLMEKNTKGTAAYKKKFGFGK